MHETVATPLMPSAYPNDAYRIPGSTTPPFTLHRPSSPSLMSSPGLGLVLWPSSCAGPRGAGRIECYKPPRRCKWSTMLYVGAERTCGLLVDSRAVLFSCHYLTYTVHDSSLDPGLPPSSFSLLAYATGLAMCYLDTCVTILARLFKKRAQHSAIDTETSTSTPPSIGPPVMNTVSFRA
ncbi:hypothetical protein OH77DRAFT_648429 [Trametes cingulata]|nr:hypothetical protein OH77DRAFT_648429 [Trametes cingulata]